MKLQSSPVEPSTPPEQPRLRRASRYRRADEVLPPTLLVAVQGHVESVYLWIPSAAPKRRGERDAEVMRRRERGESIHAIALALGLTARRICQIQKRERAAAAAGGA